MGGMSMNQNNLNYQKFLAEDETLVGIKIALINAIEQLDFIIDGEECDCEDGCCK